MFGYLRHVRCLTAPYEPFDIAVVGVPFDTAVSYRPGRFFFVWLFSEFLGKGGRGGAACLSRERAFFVCLRRQPCAPRRSAAPPPPSRSPRPAPPPVILNPRGEHWHN